MGKYSVPDFIRKQKPKGTMVKNISGYFYVYEYKSIKGHDGKRKTQMGNIIGSIKPGIGYVANGSFLCDSEISTLEFGEYAVTLANSQQTLALLRECFNPEDALAIYAVSIIHFIQGFTYMKDIQSYYDMSYLSIKYPSLKLGYESLSSLYDSLGRRQGSVIKMEEKLVAACSGQVAIDGHVIGCVSGENDLAVKGYKFGKIGEPQINLLMAYDINTGIPLLSRIYEGASTDKVSVKDLTRQVELKNMLFVIDRGFYSAENLKLFSSDGNSYIIPLAKNITACKKAVSSLEMTGRFMYQQGLKASVVEYKDEMIDGNRVITYRDLNESAAEQTNYLRHMGMGDKAYTQEGFDKLKDFMGVIVLQTSIMGKTPQEIYELYKKRWTIETYYHYFKNKADYGSLYQQDYYKTQGLAFIMLVSSLIHKEFEDAVKAVKGKSAQDCLLDARMVKADKRRGVWTVCNCRKKQVELFESLNTKLAVEIDQYT
ncbi:MAG: transposase [Bacillota bacterium]|nr:transposase [Bacillota bacterium]